MSVLKSSRSLDVFPTGGELAASWMTGKTAPIQSRATKYTHRLE